MPIPGALSGASQTTIRGGGAFERYLVLHTPSVMLQFNPSVNASGKNNAAITYSTTLDGAYTNVLLGMFVVISPTTDYESDLKNDRANCHVTYVRAAATSTTLAIGMTNFQWTTSDVVTVLDMWNVHYKPDLISNNDTIYKDFNIVYRAPLPRIDDLYWDVILSTNGSDADYSPTPSAEAMANGATISSYSWQVIENGTLTDTSTSATPTFTLSVGTAWLHLTVTDSNGNTNWFAALIAIVPDDYSSVVHQSAIGTVDNDLNDGLSADLTAYGSVSGWIPGSPALVFLRALYKDGTITETVEMAGWLGRATDELAGDAQAGRTQTFRAQLVGITERLRSINLAGYPVNQVASPAKWGEFARVTVYDSLWYAISEHSTAGNVAALDLPSDHTNYRASQVDVPGTTLDSILTELSFRASGGLPNWSPNGEIVLRKSLLYEDDATTRNNATVYATYAQGDAEIINASVPAELSEAFGAVLAGSASFDSSTNQLRPVAAQGPGGFVPGALQETVDGVILDKDLSAANTLSTAGKLAANHYFAAVDSTTLDLQLLAGYHGLVPTAYQWHKASVAAADWLFGLVFDTNTRCLCLRKTVSVAAETGAADVRITLRQETDGGSNYAPEVEWLATQSAQRRPAYPIASFYPGISDADLSPDTYGDDLDNYNDGWQDGSLPDEQAADETYSSDTIVREPLRGGLVSGGTGANGDYLLKLSGKGIIQPADGVGLYNFSGGANGWAGLTNADTGINDDARPDSGEPAAGTITAGGWESVEYTQVNGSLSEAVYVFTEFSDSVTVLTTEALTITYDMTLGAFDFGSLFSVAISTKDSGGTWTIQKTLDFDNVSSGDGQTLSWSPVSDTEIFGIAVWVRSGVDGSAPIESPGGSTRLRKVEITGLWERQGDAFYWWYVNSEDQPEPPDLTKQAYSATKGTQIEGADPSPRPAATSNSVYEYTLTGTPPFDFEYVDEEGNLSDNEDTFIRIEIVAL